MIQLIWYDDNWLMLLNQDSSVKGILVSALLSVSILVERAMELPGENYSGFSWLIGECLVHDMCGLKTQTT